MEPVDVTAHLDTTPYKVLGMNIDPGLEAVKAAADRGLAMRNWRLQNATEFAQRQALQQAQLQAEKDIMQWHEKVANIREDTMNDVWDKRIQAQAAAAASAEKKRIEMLNQDELNREARNYSTGQVDSKTGLFMPPVPRLTNESTEDYLNRAATERAKLMAQWEGNIQKNTALLTSRIGKMAQDSEVQNQSAAHSAGVGAVNQVLQSLKPEAQQVFKAAMQKLTSAGVPYAQALQQVEQLNPAFAGVSDIYNDKANNTLIAARAVKNPIVQTQLESLGSLLKNPAALSRSDFRDMLDEHPSQISKPAFTLSPGGAASGAPAPAVVAPNPASVLGLTGIPSVDQRAQAEVQAAHMNDLTQQRLNLLSRISGLNKNIDTAVQNPMVRVPSGALGSPAAILSTPSPTYPNATEQAQAILGLQAQLPPLQKQLSDVNNQIGAEYQ